MGLVVLAMVLGCGGFDAKDRDLGDDTADSGATDSASDSGGDSGGDSGAVVPWITGVADIHCEGDPDDETWYDTITVDDPQGAQTVIDGWLYVQNLDGADLATYGLNCDDGACDGYFRAEYDGIPCAMPEDGAVDWRNAPPLRVARKDD